MAGVKRKSLDDAAGSKFGNNLKKSRTTTTAKPPRGAPKPQKQATKKTESASLGDDLIESDTSEDENGFYGFSAKDTGDGEDEGEDESDGFAASAAEDAAPVQPPSKRLKALADQDKVARKTAYKDPNGQMLVSSKEAHAKQRALAKERKAAKPNADSIARSKQLWEKLRRKSHVLPEERKKLVEELFTIISGRIREFVFKHDSVRVIQCALKYAYQSQRKQIAEELRGDFRTLAESKYAKFLLAKLVVEGDREIKNMLIEEFYGHVKRLINHPEASWILDDIYRQIATKEQKALLLSEWYGAEFALFRNQNARSAPTSLANILQESPEKRQPILQHLHHLINQLIQKKLTGFTMLHDAMLQYYLNCKPGSEEATDFLQLLQGQGDEEEKDHDLLKNLAFTASGARVVCMAFAYGNAKDRRHLLKVYKDMLEIIAHDQHAHNVILAAYDVVDDTKGTFKAFFPELIGGKEDEQQRQVILEMANHPNARATLLYPFAAAASAEGLPKWLLSAKEISILEEMHELRGTTSKKDPDLRRQELIQLISAPLLNVVTADTAALADSKFGCQFIAELLLAAGPDADAAIGAVAQLVRGDPLDDGHLVHNASQARMIKTLIQGGHFNPEQKQVHRVADSSSFCEKVFAEMSDIGNWATSEGAFTLVALLENDQWPSRSSLLDQLRQHKKNIKQELARTEKHAGQNKEAEQGAKAKLAGMKKLLEKL